MNPSPEAIDIWLKVGQSGPYVALFVLLAVLTVTILAGFLYFSSRVTKAVERQGETLSLLAAGLAVNNERIAHIDNALERLRDDVNSIMREQGRKEGRRVPQHQ